MSEYAWAGKMLDLGGLGIACFLMWKLFDKWAALFLNAQTGQAKALTDQAMATAALATAVRDGQADQREILIAVRVLADRIDTQKEYLQGIEKSCRERCQA